MKVYNFQDCHSGITCFSRIRALRSRMAAREGSARSSTAGYGCGSCYSPQGCTDSDSSALHSNGAAYFARRERISKLQCSRRCSKWRRLALSTRKTSCLKKRAVIRITWQTAPGPSPQPLTSHAGQTRSLAEGAVALRRCSLQALHMHSLPTNLRSSPSLNPKATCKASSQARSTR